MSTLKLTERLIPIFDKAIQWYSTRNGANLPAPACMINPDSALDVDPESKDAFALFYTKSDCFSQISYSGTILKGISTHTLPLLAGIHQRYPTSKLAKIIEHHNISVDDFEDIWLSRQGESKLFEDCKGESIYMVDAHISAWMAFESLGMIEQRLNAPEASNFAAMHTQCEGAWPATILRTIAEGNLADDGDHLMNPTDIVGSWRLSKESHFPGNNACAFLRRSGMLESAAYRKQLAFHHQWEDLCLAADEPGGHLALRLLLTCKDLEPEERLKARDALRSMHPDRGTTHQSMSRVFQFVETWFMGTDLDISGSTVMKLNLSSVLNDAKSTKSEMARQPEVYADILQKPQQVLGSLCREILSLRADQISYADLAAFRSLKRLQLGAQVIEGFRPEDVILKLEAGMQDFMGQRTKTNKLTERMYDAMSDAFKLFGNHAWDYSAFKGCSEQIVLTLVRGGAAMGKLPDMGRKRRGEFLEDELGL